MQALFAIVSTVLHLGNIKFHENKHGMAEIDDLTPVEIVSQVRYVTPVLVLQYTVISWVILERSIILPQSIIVNPFSITKLLHTVKLSIKCE